jgi:hypothetical protein
MFGVKSEHFSIIVPFRRDPYFVIAGWEKATIAKKDGCAFSGPQDQQESPMRPNDMNQNLSFKFGTLPTIYSYLGEALSPGGDYADLA